MAATPELHTHRFRAMNCEMTANVYSDHPLVSQALSEVESWMQEVETALSRFRDDSDLSRLNRAAGKPYPAGDLLWEVTQAALAAAAQTDGVFDPAIGQALIAAGYDRSFEQIDSSRPAMPAPTAAAKPRPNWRQIEMDATARTITLPAGVQLDLGGIAKGWAADRGLAILSAFGPALIDAGGDLAIGAPPPAAPGWPVAVADPLAPATDLALLQLSQCGLATSGVDHRKWRTGGRQQHHLIDPALGVPAHTRILNTSVVAATATAADVLALTLTILDLAGVQNYLEQQPDLPVLIVLNDGNTYQTNALAAHVVAYHPRYS